MYMSINSCRVIWRVSEHDLQLVGFGGQQVNVIRFHALRRQVLQHQHETLEVRLF